jgi:hypothetical protein
MKVIRIPGLTLSRFAGAAEGGARRHQVLGGGSMLLLESGQRGKTRAVQVNVRGMSYGGTQNSARGSGGS